MLKTSLPVFRPLVIALIAMALAACGDEESPATAADAAPTADRSPSQQNDPTIINEPIPRDSLLTDIRLVSAPQYLPETDEILFRVEVTNNGTAVLSGLGERPVLLGVVHVEESKEIFTPIAAAKRDSLPILREGESGVVTINVAVESILGLPLELGLFQQGVAFFGKSYGLPVISVGPFNRCDGVAGTLCNVDGTAVVRN